MLKFTKILIAFSWAIFVFALLSKPITPGIYEFTFLDKIVHFFLFGILAYLIVWALENKKIKTIILFSFFISIFYAFAGEYWQKYIPGRFPDILDSLAATLGILAFLFLAYKKFKKPKLLLHICCVGCGVYVSKNLKKNFRVTLYFYNPNIFPEEEWQIRLKEAKKIARKFWLKIITEKKYTHKGWLKLVKGHEKDEEGGERCEICYHDRLEKTARLARKFNYQYFTTTLSTSPHKNFAKIEKIAEKLGEKYNLIFLNEDFKKQDGFKKSCAMSKKLKLYRQNYCGCEFSREK